MVGSPVHGGREGSDGAEEVEAEGSIVLSFENREERESRMSIGVKVVWPSL